MGSGIVVRDAHFPGRAPIDAYGNGGFRFADMSHRGSILCLPSGIHGWEPAHRERWTIADFDRVLAEADAIEILLVGSGPDLRPLGRELRDLFRSHGIARVIADTVDNPGRELTAGFAYCRLQGPARPDAAGYTEADIADWAHTVRGWADAGHDVFAYFVHEDKLHAPDNAIALRKAAGVTLPGD